MLARLVTANTHDRQQIFTSLKIPRKSYKPFVLSLVFFFFCVKESLQQITYIPAIWQKYISVGVWECFQLPVHAEVIWQRASVCLSSIKRRCSRCSFHCQMRERLSSAADHIPLLFLWNTGNKHTYSHIINLRAFSGIPAGTFMSKRN